jgi:acyl-CoA synthetase (AMP-forming)/AMP-acid ligase II
MLAFLPFFAAIPEQVLPAQLEGGCLEVRAGFDPDEIADSCLRATTLDAVPTLMARLLDTVDHARLARLRWVMFASEPMPPALLARWWGTLPSVGTHQFYGMTEMLTITSCDPATQRAAPASVGIPFPGSRVAVVDPDGRPLPPGEDGEVVCASPGRMRGYLPEGIEPATWQLPDGSMRTGDQGRFDEAGRLQLTGRIKDLIISGGLNIAPAEVEAVAAAHPAVAAATVVGIPDARWGETPVVVVLRRPGAALAAAELLGHCRDGLASFKRPSGVVFVESLPTTGIGKSARGRLRERILSGELEVERGV